MAGVEKLITEHLDVWTSAIKKRNATGRGSNKKIELTGIKKLRELILELAVRGKLVPQDASEESASVLLDKIAEEKAQLIVDKKIKKQKSLSVITDEEKPFELPIGWEWSRLACITNFVNGYAFKSKDFEDIGVGIIKIGDIQDGQVATVSMSRVPQEVVDLIGDDFQVRKGDLLIAMSGATTGKLGFNTSDETFYLNQRVGKIQSFGVLLEYLYFPLTTKIAENLSKAIGSAIPNISTTQINEIVIALPPLAEQHRIVAKVDELMALCDQLEQQTEQSLSAHQTLVEVLLASLTNGTSPDIDSKEDFQTSWQRIAEHFDVLFTTEASIEQLKQTILQLAVMGKLVPQNPNDEPASVLLEKIADEKAQLIADKKIKKQKPLPAITEDEKTFELPNCWSFARIGQITNVIDPNPSHRYPSYEGGTVPLLSTREFSGIDGWDVTTAKLVPESFFDYQKEACKFDQRDIVFARKGRLGLARKLPNLKMFTFSHTVFIIKSSINVNEDFLLLFLRREKLVQDLLIAMNSNVGVPTLGKAKLEAMVMLIPPLAEQYRIVAKVDELMALCDQLKTRLTDTQITQLHLADAVVENALN